MSLLPQSNVLILSAEPIRAVLTPTCFFAFVFVLDRLLQPASTCSWKLHSLLGVQMETLSLPEAMSGLGERMVQDVAVQTKGDSWDEDPAGSKTTSQVAARHVLPTGVQMFSVMRCHQATRIAVERASG